MAQLPSSKIRWLCLNEHLDETSESNFEFAAYELSKAVKILQEVKRQQEAVSEEEMEEKKMSAYKATLLLKAIHRLEEQVVERKRLERIEKEKREREVREEIDRAIREREAQEDKESTQVSE